MLDLNRKLTLEGIPQIQVYPDHELPSRFYLVPATPRVSLDGQGKPLLSLLIYRRGKGRTAKVIGGQLSLTVNLAVTQDEQSSVSLALAQQSLPQVDLVSPDWTEGQVTARLTMDVELTGTPSLLGANECLLMANLSPDQARALRKAGRAGFPEATVSYRLLTQVAQTTRTVAHLDGVPQGSITLDTTVTDSVPYEMLVEGPLGLTAMQARKALQVISF